MNRFHMVACLSMLGILFLSALLIETIVGQPGEIVMEVHAADSRQKEIIIDVIVKTGDAPVSYAGARVYPTEHVSSVFVETKGVPLAGFINTQNQGSELIRFPSSIQLAPHSSKTVSFHLLLDRTIAEMRSTYLRTAPPNLLTDSAFREEVGYCPSGDIIITASPDPSSDDRYETF